MNNIFCILIFYCILNNVCNAQNTIITNKIYIDSGFTEDYSPERKEGYILYKNYEEDKIKKNTIIVILKIREKKILFNGSKIKINGDGNRIIGIAVIYQDDIKNIQKSSFDFKGEIIIKKFINEKNLSFYLKLKCLNENLYKTEIKENKLDIDKLIEFN